MQRDPFSSDDELNSNSNLSEIIEDENQQIKKEIKNEPKQENSSYSDDLDDSFDSKKETHSRKIPVILPNENNTRKFRACVRCHLIKTEQQFKEKSCENCKQYLDKLIRDGADMKSLFVKYQGMIGLADVKTSWLGRKINSQIVDQNQKDIVAGGYALCVYPQDFNIYEDMASLKIAYVDNEKM
ncbi:hypothetical protein PPERSA_00950 [Pseudocohnilembus persalinus]|uniref:Spt4/RpoE2 zinc finger domain-containing protein n=1 Tax=Pseudocohnilembus persalinus TaxID=266149 RepID=A0A0V0R8F9_PSEPJ|nr:hypothetical protein PPERSA_00950 [Pseudocohnilembus persalinus]|eukprot:KRX10780.1 hypothetical protein PPERSA_00950 [Pseudocohnilembus persalinus]